MVELLFVCLSLSLVLYQNKQSYNHDYFTTNSPFYRTRFIAKFERGHPERGRKPDLH